MKCERCNNLMSITYKDGAGRSFCILAGVFYTNMKSCTHFEEKEDTKERPKQEAKEVANKGKYPRKQPKKKVEGCVKCSGTGELAGRDCQYCRGTGNTS